MDLSRERDFAGTKKSHTKELWNKDFAREHDFLRSKISSRQFLAGTPKFRVPARLLLFDDYAGGGKITAISTNPPLTIKILKIMTFLLFVIWLIAGVYIVWFCVDNLFLVVVAALFLIVTTKMISTALKNLQKENQELKKDCEEIKGNYEKLLKKIEGLGNGLSEKISDQSSTLESIRKFSVGKEADLRRLRECYDMRIKRNFIERLIDVVGDFDSKIEALEMQNISQEHLEDLCFMRKCLLNALDGEGVVSFGDELLCKYEVPEEMRKDVKLIVEETDDEKFDNIIFKLQERGFKLFEGDKEKSLHPATLLRYKYVKPKESQEK